MYIYQEKDNLLHKIHPLVLISYCVVLSLFALLFSHPFYLLGLFAAVALVIKAADIFKEWLFYLKLSSALVLMILLINTLFVQLGSTVLLWGPYIPGLGKLRITLEAVLFGLNMGLRFLIIMSAFCLLTFVLHPDRALHLMGRLGNKWVLALTISTRLLPLMVSDFGRIYDVQRCRGVSFNGKSRLKRVKNFLPIFNAMVISSLERAFQLAEALQARGYGVGKRTLYSRELLRPRDYLIFLSVTLAVIAGIWLTWQGAADFTFYPRIQRVYLKEGLLAIFYSLFYIIPAILAWGWQKCRLLKLKI
ncbi:MAG: energy-coupling factor transporter transmembrane protein EcfT [Clostridia bacterium]|nr:energy-coupling factor transporter transmembrane protein EcfT [Clostridia bacterium]